MKKILAMILCIMLVFSLALVGCNSSGSNGSSDPQSNAVLKESAADIIAYIYEIADEDEEFNGRKERFENITITEENSNYHLGTTGIPYEEALVSESPISTSAYSMGILKVKEGEDPESVRKTVEENINPRKWICVGAEKVYVESIDDVIFFVMADEKTAEMLRDAFLSLK